MYFFFCHTLRTVNGTVCRECHRVVALDFRRRWHDYKTAAGEVVVVVVVVRDPGMMMRPSGEEDLELVGGIFQIKRVKLNLFANPIDT